MNDAPPLQLSDARPVFRLLGEVRELGADPFAWRRHLLEGLLHILRAQVGMAGEVAEIGPSMKVIPLVDVGWRDAAQRDGYMRYLTVRAYRRDPLVDLTLTRHTEPYLATADVIGRAEWEASEAATFRQVAGLSEFVYSSAPTYLPRHVASWSLLRAAGEPPFAETECRLALLVSEELAHMWNPPSAARAVGAAHGAPHPDGGNGSGADRPLPPRLRQVLDFLRAGLSEKEIGIMLALSAHTVHDYVKTLHKQYDASTRGELLARATARPLLRRGPALFYK
jgi:DNA-binding CsgD family transcriptional regulator